MMVLSLFVPWSSCVGNLLFFVLHTIVFFCFFISTLRTHYVWLDVHSSPYQGETRTGCLLTHSVLSQGEESLGMLAYPNRTTSLFLCDPGELVIAEPHHLPELGGLGAVLSGGSCWSWSALCVDNLTPGRTWILSLTVGKIGVVAAGDMPIRSFRFPGGS